jgi:hypothetical protein
MSLNDQNIGPANAKRENVNTRSIWYEKIYSL